MRKTRDPVERAKRYLLDLKLAEEADRKGTATAPVVHRGDRPPPSAEFGNDSGGMDWMSSSTHAESGSGNAATGTSARMDGVAS